MASAALVEDEVRGSRPSAATSCAPRCASASRRTRCRRRRVRPSARASAGPGFDALAAHERPPAAAGRAIATVVVQLPLGDITSDQMRAVAALVAEHGNGTLRATNDQNLVLPWVPKAALPAVHAGARRDRPRRTPDAGTDRPTSCRARAWTTARSRSRARWAWRSASVPISWTIPPTGDGFAARLGRFGDQDQRLPELLRPAPRRRHRPHRPLGDGERRRPSGRTTRSWSAARWARDAGGSGSGSGAIPRRTPRRRSPASRSFYEERAPARRALPGVRRPDRPEGAPAVAARAIEAARGVTDEPDDATDSEVGDPEIADSRSRPWRSLLPGRSSPGCTTAARAARSAARRRGREYRFRYPLVEIRGADPARRRPARGHGGRLRPRPGRRAAPA